MYIGMDANMQHSNLCNFLKCWPIKNMQNCSIQQYSPKRWLIICPTFLPCIWTGQRLFPLAIGLGHPLLTKERNAVNTFPIFLSYPFLLHRSQMLVMSPLARWGSSPKSTTRTNCFAAARRIPSCQPVRLKTPGRSTSIVSLIFPCKSQYCPPAFCRN